MSSLARQRETKPRDGMVGVHGILLIRVISAQEKKEVNRIRLDNLILNNFRTRELHALAGDNYSDCRISEIQIGTNSTAAVVTDTTITNPTSVSVTYEYPSTGGGVFDPERSVKFSGTLATTEGNGKTFCEAGLSFFGAGLVSRVVYDAMKKSSLFSWDYEWTIYW